MDTHRGFLDDSLGVGGGGFSPTFLIAVGDKGRSFVRFGVGAGGFINIDLSTVAFFSGCPPTGVADLSAVKKINPFQKWRKRADEKQNFDKK